MYVARDRSLRVVIWFGSTSNYVVQQVLDVLNPSQRQEIKDRFVLILDLGFGIWVGFGIGP